jgi:hypothetical protein
MTPIATNFVTSKRLEKSWLRAACHPFLESSSAFSALGDSSATNEARFASDDNERMKSFNRQMLALAIVFIMVIAWRIVAEWHRK